MEDKVDELFAYIKFLVECIKEVQGPSATVVLPPVFRGLETFANELLQDGALIEMLLDYSDLLAIHSKGIFYIRDYNILV